MAPPPAQTLAELKAGTQAVLFVRIEDLSAGTTKTGSPYYRIEVADPTGRATVKVWSDQKAYEPSRTLARGQVIKLQALVEKAPRPIELKALQIRLATDEEGAGLAASEPELPAGLRAVAEGIVAFDIETFPRVPLGELPERERAKILRLALEDARRETGAESPDDEAVQEAVRKLLALNALTTRVVSLAFHCLDTGAELALVAVEGAEVEPPAQAVGERDLLVAFWAVASKVRVLVGFNSRRFDVPVLLTRSALLGVNAPVDLLADRYGRDARHIDLQDVLAARGAAQDRRVSLELAAFAFGIPAKSSGHGSEVAWLVEDLRCQELAEYNLEDARATAQLYARLRGSWL